MPWDDNSEKGILSCIFHDPNLVLSDRVSPELFYHQCNRIIFEQMLAFEATGKPVEYIGFTKWLRDREMLDQVGGAGTLSELLNFVPTPAHFGYYANILRDQAILRKIIHTSTEHIEKCYEPQEDIPAFLDTVEQEVLNIRPKDNIQKPESMRQSIMTTFELMEEQMKQKADMIGLSTGMAWVDKLTQGLKPETWFVGARPSVGKTSIALQFIISLAVHQNIPCGFFSLEMSQDAVNRRLISMVSGIPLDRILSAKLVNGDLPKYHEAVKALHKAPIWVDDRPGLMLNQVRAKARRWKREHGVRAIFGDYIQRMGLDRKGKGSSTTDLHSGNVTGVTDMGKEMGFINVWLAQLNRECMKRTDHRPFMSDFEGCGRIEQDADLAMLLSPTKEQPEDENYRHILVDIPKQRNGATDARVHEFYRPTVTFSKFPVRATA
jgi:replicative DNA helicase